MRINHNVSALWTHGSMIRVQREMDKSLVRLSTGLRINTAADDAAGLAVSEGLRTQVRGLAQALRNGMDGIAALTVAEGAANEISDILQRMRELAIQSANDTLTSIERNYTNQEFQALNDEIDRIAAVTNYNRMRLLSGDGPARFGDASILWVDANSVLGSDGITVTIDTLSNGTLGGGLGTETLALSSQTAAQQAISTLDSAVDSVNRVRSNLGAVINRLERGMNNLTLAGTNQQAAESVLRDADFAFEASVFAGTQILMRSSVAMLAQANMAPRSVLALMQ